jgi:hypothetical protein
LSLREQSAKEIAGNVASMAARPVIAAVRRAIPAKLKS